MSQEENTAEQGTTNVPNIMLVNLWKPQKQRRRFAADDFFLSNVHYP